jgi:hypothetical protein
VIIVFGRSIRAVASKFQKENDIEMKRFLPSGFMFFAGVLGIAAVAANTDQDVTKIRKKFDLREAILRRFFNEKHCPAETYAGVFVTEADVYGLDWRLLPSLSIVETGGGQHAPGNNLFGWANGKVRFGSVAEAIHQVASTLSLGKAYRGKNLEAKLLTYNHSTDYQTLVTSIMRQIAVSPVVEPADSMR